MGMLLAQASYGGLTVHCQAARCAAAQHQAAPKVVRALCAAGEAAVTGVIPVPLDVLAAYHLRPSERSKQQRGDRAAAVVPCPWLELVTGSCTKPACTVSVRQAQQTLQAPASPPPPAHPPAQPASRAAARWCRTPEAPGAATPRGCPLLPRPPPPHGRRGAARPWQGQAAGVGAC